MRAAALDAARHGAAVPLSPHRNRRPPSVSAPRRPCAGRRAAPRAARAAHAAVRMLREELQLLQEPGSYVGEVTKVMGRKKVLVKVRAHARARAAQLFAGRR